MVNPALLGGMIGVLMLVAWALGRWQAGPAPSANGPAALPLQREPEAPRTTPQARMPGLALYQQHSRSDGVAVYDNTISLCDLHAEVTAFRRREQVLAADALLLDGLLRTSARACVAKAAMTVPNGAGYHRGRV